MTGNMSKEKPTKEVVVQKEKFSIESLIKDAIKNNTPVETMERLLAMRTQLKNEQAKEEFSKSMSKFQADCPVIKKDKAGGKTNSGVVAYYYAPLESIITQVGHLIQLYGFRYNFQTITGEDKVKVTCIVTHELGHSENSDVEVPLGAKTGVMSAPQVTASALTFAKRYAFCNAFGIMTGDEDNDAQTVRSQSKSQVRDIQYDDSESQDKPEPTERQRIAYLATELGIPLDKNMPQAIKELTTLDVVDSNFKEITARLEILVEELKQRNEIL